MKTQETILLNSLQFIDRIVLFSEKHTLPAYRNHFARYSTKGGDYKVEEITGHELVLRNGGEVILVPFIDGFSTTNIINKIKQD